MSRKLLVCPACSSSATPRPTGPNLAWHLCPECWTKTPFDELHSTEEWTRTTLAGQREVHLLQTLYATGGRNVRYTDPNPGTGSISEDASNTIAGTHDNNDSTADVFTLTATGAKSSGTAFVDYTFQPATAPGQIEFVRYWLRARASGNIASLGTLQMDHRGLAAPFSRVPTTDWEWFTADVTVFRIGVLETETPWTNALVDSGAWFVEIPLSIQNGPDTCTVEVSECRLELWGRG